MLMRNTLTLLLACGFLLVPLCLSHDSDDALNAQRYRESEREEPELTLAEGSTQENPLFNLPAGRYRVRINDLMELLTKASGENFIVSAQISSLLTNKEVDVYSGAQEGNVNLWNFTQTVLFTENLILVAHGGSHTIVQITDAMTSAQVCESEEELNAARDMDFVRMTIHLQHADCNQVRAALTQLMTRRAGIINPVPGETNALVIADYAGNLRSILQTIKALDKPRAERKPLSVKVSERYAEHFVSLAKMLYGVDGMVENGTMRFFWTLPDGSEEVSLREITALRDECERED